MTFWYAGRVTLSTDTFKHKIPPQTYKQLRLENRAFLLYSAVYRGNMMPPKEK